MRIFRLRVVLCVLFGGILFWALPTPAQAALDCVWKQSFTNGLTAQVHFSCFSDSFNVKTTYDWGTDGTSATTFEDIPVNYTYPQAGTYNIQVWAREIDNSQNMHDERFSSINVTVSAPPPVNGTCSNPQIHYNCASGTLGDTAEYPTEAHPEISAYQWWCNGSNGGSNQLCNEDKAPPPPPAAGTIRVSSNRNTSWTVSGPQNFFGSGTSATYSTGNFGGYGISVSDLSCFNKSVSPGSMNVTSGSDQTFTITYTDNGSCTTDVPGCTDPLAFNYNPSATVDNGSCTYRYACNGSNQCVKNPSGGFTSDTCNGACAPSPGGVCSATHYNCSTGTAVNGSDNSTNWTWLCRISGAADASCAESKPPAPPSPPTNLSGSCAVGATQANMSWSLPAGFSLSYFRIADNTAGGAIMSSFSIPESRPDNGPATSVAVTPGHSYHWWVHTRTSDPAVFSPQADGNFSCPVTPVPGCTNPAASNYNPAANTDDGSCTFTCSGSATRDCSSGANACGQTASGTESRTCNTSNGTWSGWGACSASTPANPAGLGNACTGQMSSPNACGMTNPGGSGTIQCSGACSGANGVTPANSSCPAPTTSSATYSTPDYCQSGPGGFIAWSYSDPNNSPQSAYQIQISDTGNFNSPMYDSGQINSGSHVFAIPPGILQFNTTYRARVRTWNTFTAVSAWSNLSSTWKTPGYAYPNVRPPSQFTWPTLPKPQQNQSIQFTDHTVFGGGNANSRTWSWNFGDGTTSTQQSPAHTYPNVGNYTVTQTVTDAANQTCAFSQSINIQKPIPVIKEVAPR